MDPNPAGSSLLRWGLLGAAALVVVVASGIWLLSLLPDEIELQVGDAASVVTEVLGEAAAEYRSKSEIEASRIAHYEFRSLTDTSAPLTKASGLPEVVVRALWFPFLGTSGTLVYLDASDRVTAVFIGGT